MLPKKLPLAAEIYGYDRLGGLCPGAFLQRWYNTTARSYIYPPQNGFQLNTASQPIEGNQTLTVGMRLDRFGSEFGFFLSPIGAPYNQRAIPPSNLDTPPTEPNFPYNYHVYEVVKSFDTLSGPVAGTPFACSKSRNCLTEYLYRMVWPARTGYSISNVFQCDHLGKDI